MVIKLLRKSTLVIKNSMPVPKWDDFTAWKAIAIVLKQLGRGREGGKRC